MLSPALRSPRFPYTTLFRNDGARISGGRRVRLALTPTITSAYLIHRAPVVVVLQREVASPHRGIIGGVVQGHDTIERIPGFLLSREDVHQQRRHAGDRQRTPEHGEHEPAAAKVPRARRGIRAPGIGHPMLLAW